MNDTFTGLAALVLGALLAPSGMARQGCSVPAAIEAIGAGTAGSGGILELSSVGVPGPGHVFNLRLEGGAPGAAALLLLGDQSVAIPVPVYGATLYADGNPLIAIPFALGPDGNASIGGPIPAASCGATIVAQIAAMDAQAQGGAAFSNGLRLTLGAAGGQLLPGPKYDTVAAPHDVVAGDLDGDGNQDLVCLTSNFLGVDTRVLRGTGGGLFEPASAFLLGSNPLSAVISDFDGDGAPDVATANELSNDASVVLGVGDGTFGAPHSLAAGTKPVSIDSADLDGDGAFDIVVANEISNDVSVLLGAGNGTFAAAVQYPAGARPVSVEIADFNGDGTLDLAVANATALGTTVLIGLGNGTFGPPTSFAAGTANKSLEIADFNNDGKSDLAVVGGSSVYVLRGVGNGSFLSANMVAVGNFPVALTVGDMNGDGDADLQVAQANSIAMPNEVLIRYGNGNATFAAGAESISVGNFPHALTVGDLDGDGDADLAVANKTSRDVSVVLIDTSAPYANALEYDVWGKPRSVVVSDLNEDGLPDLVVANELTGTGYGVNLLFGQGGVTFSAATPVPTYNGTPRYATTDDLDGDGHQDLVIAYGNHDMVAVRLGNGNGTFGLASNYPIGEFPSSVVVADLNGDGASDAVASGSVTMFLPGVGGGAFGAATGLDSGAGFTHRVSVADLNTDGSLDLVASCPGANAVSVLLGTGTGSFATPATYGVGSYPEWLDIGDVNEDGVADVAVGSSGTNPSVSMLLGNGNGTLAPALALEPGRRGDGIVLVDLDSDGFRDIVACDSTRDDVVFWSGKGDGSFAPAARFATGTRPGYVTTHDLNGDGLLDVLATNNQAATVSLLLNQLLE